MDEYKDVCSRDYSNMNKLYSILDRIAAVSVVSVAHTTVSRFH